MSDLERFIIIHNKEKDNEYEKALEEIKKGKKRTCWIWYILPILKGLRSSKKANYYGIKDFEEAKEYLNHELLRSHLIEMCQALLNLGDVNITDVMGYIDDIKLQQCMTLFNKVEQEMKIDCDNIFKKVLTQFFNDKEDQKTLEILKIQKNENISNNKNDKKNGK